MFWPNRRIKKRKANKPCRKLTRRLRLEPLDARIVLASGLVDVDTVTNGPGTLALYGDVSNNDVEIKQTANTPNSFTVTGKNGTLLTLNDFGAGVNPTFTTLTLNGISGDIYVDLNYWAPGGAGGVIGGFPGGVDVFTFLGQGNPPSVVPEDLLIDNTAGSNTNILDDVLVLGGVTVERKLTDGYNELHILNSEITDLTFVDNDGMMGFHGDSKTVIDNSLLRGALGTGALKVENAIGMDDFSASGNSQFGDGAPVPLFDPMVDIDNGAGPTMTVFTGASKVYGPGTTTIYGDLDIENGFNPFGTMDVTTFNGVNVFGDVKVTNFAGETETMVINSELFSDLLGTPEGPMGAGVAVYNDAGFDLFESTDSNFPWGLYIDNDFAAGGTSSFGSKTDINNSQLNTARGIASRGLTVLGDAGIDIVNIDPTTIRGETYLYLRDGNNETTIGNDTELDVLTYIGGKGSEELTIDNSRVTSRIDVDLADGADLMTIINIDPGADLPPTVGDIFIDGGNNPGDELATDFGPLVADVLGFEFFTLL